MADLVVWMTDLFAVELATVGTVTVTLGLVLVFSLISGLVIRIFKRTGGR